jgi:hypothetical protein
LEETKVEVVETSDESQLKNKCEFDTSLKGYEVRKEGRD